MDYRQIKKQANEILNNKTAECSYIEYKSSEKQLDKILKTICAYGNNYYNNDFQYIFIGVEEENNEEQKAIPVLPIKGVTEGRLEKCRNTINSLRSFLYPNVAFEVAANDMDGISYLLIIVRRQTGGPFMVVEKAEKDKKISLKPGRYVRIEADTRLARVDEEYDLLRKFSNFHFSSIVSSGASIDDLNIDLLKEYFSKTSSRQISDGMGKKEPAKALDLIDKNDPTDRRIKNYAVLMFSEHPEDRIPYAYTELIVDMFGTKRKMEFKVFKGAVWKQYYAALAYINNNFLNELVIRVDGSSDNRKIENFTYIALEELLANAIVHNNYENGKPIQIYVSEKQINIVNYNKPLPPVRISDLNERTFFNERDTVNPEIREMFKALGIIESFGTGIGEAKRSMRENGSPDLFYKTFDANDNVTSVVIPVNEEYYEIKNGTKPKKKVWIETETKDYKQKILDSGYTKKIKQNILKLYEEIGTEVFGNSRVVEILGCSEVTATSYLKRMENELKIISPVEGMGKGKYRFTSKGGAFMEKYIEGNKAAWEEAFDYRDASWGADIADRIQKEDYPFFYKETVAVLQKIHTEGTVIGQFCCNNGRELLSLVKSGKAAKGIGFDIAENQVAFANEKAKELGLPCVFEAVNVYDIDDRYKEQFDIVIITIGALCWFDDLNHFFAMVAKCMKPGARVVINEQHPCTNMLASEDEKEFDPEHRMECHFSYFEHEWTGNGGMYYMTKKSYHSKTFTDFTHSMSEIISGMCSNGIVVTGLQEFDYDISGGFAALDHSGFPLSMLIQGQKQAEKK